MQRVGIVEIVGNAFLHCPLSVYFLPLEPFLLTVQFGHLPLIGRLAHGYLSHQEDDRFRVWHYASHLEYPLEVAVESLGPVGGINHATGLVVVVQIGEVLEIGRPV